MSVESFLVTKLFGFSRQNAEIFCIFMIQDFVKPHKISAFYLDKQKTIVPKKDSTPWLIPIGDNQGVKFKFYRDDCLLALCSQ